MKRIHNIKLAIYKDKELLKRIEKESDIDSFIEGAKAYIKAIKEGRMICNIASVSYSGMSRTIKFIACERNSYNKKYSYRQFWALFKVLGYREAHNNRGYFSIHGCGMDMIFNTNYTNIQYFYELGIISKKECSILAQNTPTII